MFGLAPLEVSFDGSGSTWDHPGGIVAYEWDFGDGDVGYGKTTSHTYVEPGMYPIRLTVFEASGETSSSEGGFGGHTVAVLSSPEASFVATPDSGPAPLDVGFDGTSSTPYRAPGVSLGHGILYKEQEIAEFTWDFGDGTTGSGSGYPGRPGFFGGIWWDEPVRHTYTTPGAYIVTLTVTDNYGYTAATTRTIHVTTASDDAPGDEEPDDDPPGDDPAPVFEVQDFSWEWIDEEDDPYDGCILLSGDLANVGSIAARAELMSTAYDEAHNPVGSATFWVSGTSAYSPLPMNIPPGYTQQFWAVLCDVTGDVASVEVIVTSTQILP
jgi:PKD repeat protein